MNPIAKYYFGCTAVYNGLKRTNPNLVQIGKIKSYLSEVRTPSKIALNIGNIESSIESYFYEMLLLRFGGEAQHKVTITSFLDLKNYIDELGLSDLCFIHLPNLSVIKPKSQFNSKNYYNLLNNNIIRQHFNHDIGNRKYEYTITEKIRNQINPN